ncbi:uncharacterized protein At4g06598-like isoform X2 [Lycium ferocissimum]|uniref:uncharacterized protein At4g06598-like isoform X2 n=1 Tax=Lycium ferocissimum TaxID=112874 RepID=UPI00281510D2|nr:uncharacterized protein At4g06598-like isoform X2 [Lycium ferocissimum]
MANSKGPSSMRHMMYNGKSSLLPPKSPFPSTSSSYVDYLPTSAVTQKGISKPRDGSHHQRTSSESCIIEEQPSWLDDLLNEPETPVRRGGHRRSSSDSFTYCDAANITNLDYIAQDDNKFRNITPVASWGSQDFDYYKDARHATLHVDQNSSNRQKSRARDASPNAIPHRRGLPPSRESVKTHSLGSSCPPQERERPKSAGRDKQDFAESVTPDPKGSGETQDSSHSKSSASENDTKRAKQPTANVVGIVCALRNFQGMPMVVKSYQSIDVDKNNLLNVHELGSFNIYLNWKEMLKLCRLKVLRCPLSLNSLTRRLLFSAWRIKP